MISLALFLALVFAVLAVALYAAALAFQAAFYEQPIDGLPWRAPAAAGVLTLFLAAAGWLDATFPNRFGSPFQFALLEVQAFDHFWSEKRSDTGVTTLTLFEQRSGLAGRSEYYDRQTGRAWDRSGSGIVTAILVEEDGERKRFEAQLDPQGNFIRDPNNPNRTLPVEFVEDGGQERVMSEDSIGRLTVFRPWAMLVNWLFNLLHLLLWIGVATLLLNLHWHHALLLGVIGWSTTLIIIWPPLADRVHALGVP